MTEQPTRQTLEELERSHRMAETLQVLAQPHRRGDDSDMADPLGMFVRAYQCGRECYEAGWDYFRLVYRWRIVMGVPVPLRLSEGENSAGGEAEPDVVREWLLKIKRCEEAMKCSGLPGFKATQAMILDWVCPEEKQAQPVKRALHSLAMELGKFPF